MTRGVWGILRDGPVARFVFETAGRPPTLSPEVLDALADAIDREAAAGARAAVVESASPGIFAAGADLRVIRELSPTEGYLYARTGQDALSRIARAACSTIVEIDGACYGGALDLAAACDVRFASSRAAFCHPGPRLGIVTGWGGTAAIPRRIGTGRARRVFRSGEVFGAFAALALGLVDEVTAPADLSRRVSDAASRIAQAPWYQRFR